MISRDSYASATNAARSRQPTFLSTLLTWVLAVSGLITSRPAISALLSPSATRRMISSSFGELGEPRRRLRGIATRGELGDQPARDAGGEQRVAGGNGLDRLQELARARVLEQEAAGSGAQRAVDVVVEVEGGEHEHASGGEVLVGADQPGRFETVEHGHAD